MSNQINRGLGKKKSTQYATKDRFDGVRMQLPKSVVEARAGLIPSSETDAIPPPVHLTVAELTAWYRGLPVFCECD